jgi:hypothetical protein
VSLEGSLQTVPLPEVLHLLADTSKSGELFVCGPGSGGRFWFEAGQYTGFDVGRCDHAVDALFELLRIERGDFVFDGAVPRPAGAHRPDDAERGDIRPVLELAEARLFEWCEIVSVVPSLSHEVYLLPEAPRERVALDRGQWSMVVGVGEGRTVADLLADLALPEFDGCRMLKTLVDAGLTEVSDPAERLDEDEVAIPDNVTVIHPVGTPEAHNAEEPEDSGGLGGSAREALNALIDGITVDGVLGEDAGTEDEADDDDGANDAPPVNEPAEEPSAEVVVAQAADHHTDGLADRGPWTINELASLDGATAAHPLDDGPEPLNRGLLLKFLSSVRS